LYFRFNFYNNGQKLAYSFYQPAEISIWGSVLVSPKSLLFGVTAAGEVIHEEIKLFNEKTFHPIKVLSVKSSDSNTIYAEIAQNIPGENIIKVSYKAPEKKGADSGYIIKSGG